jgi:integrase
VFPSIRGRPLSRDAVEELVARHAQRAQQACPSLKQKTVSPHVLRHYVVFPTMSGEVGGIAGSAVNCRSHRVVARSISRHSFPDTTDC